MVDIIEAEPNGKVLDYRKVWAFGTRASARRSSSSSSSSSSSRRGRIRSSSTGLGLRVSPRNPKKLTIEAMNPCAEPNNSCASRMA